MRKPLDIIQPRPRLASSSIHNKPIHNKRIRRLMINTPRHRHNRMRLRQTNSIPTTTAIHIMLRRRRPITQRHIITVQALASIMEAAATVAAGTGAVATRADLHPGQARVGLAAVTSAGTHLPAIPMPAVVSVVAIAGAASAWRTHKMRDDRSR